ncbi:MAG: choice-of-anchor K domain-containing protein [Brevefilum sp.]|jgi:hypothetical protein
MKKKYLYIIGSVILLSMLGGGVASAFTVGNVDGVWGGIDIYDGPSTVIDVVGVIGENPGSYWSGGGNLRTQDRTLVRQPSVCDGNPSGSANLDGWIGYSDRTYTYLGSHTINETCSPTDLFISEYVETSSGFMRPERRALEIYNGTGKAVDLSDYDIYIYENGSSTPTSQIFLKNTFLGDGEVWVIGNRQDIGNATINQITSNLNFDGNDAVALVKGRSHRDDAECSRWVSGGTSSSMWSDNWWNQTNWPGPNPSAGIFDEDENLVLYGRETEYRNGRWTQVRCENTDIANQSGFGFRGIDTVPSPQAKQPFYLGQFTHYNNPIFSWAYGDSSDSNAFEMVKLTVTVPVVCGDEQTSREFAFDAFFHLEETSNTEGECEYGDPGDEPCPDKVWVTQPSELAASFNCPEGEYTVNILGFTTEGLNGQACHLSYNPAAVSTVFITQENAANAACLWAEIDQPVADLAVAKTCHEFDNDIKDDEFYRIIVTNAGPGSSREVQIVDTLPAGVKYDTTRIWTSKLTTNGITNNQGECTVAQKTVTCDLETSLQDQGSDSTARWTIEIPVTVTGGDKENTVTVSAATYDPTPGNNTATATCDSTAACMVSFEAVNAEDGILLTWETASEVDNLGFNLYRAEDPELPRQKINPGLIPSTNPGSNLGSAYEYLDADLAAGEYFYWLEDLDFALSRTLYGPISVRVK